jgi:hypothetical protein
MSDGVVATDPAGQKVRVVQRDFDRALVLMRTQSGWGAQIYGETTDVTIPLPANEIWQRLNADGSLGSPVTTVKLGNADAAILVKKRLLF